MTEIISLGWVACIEAKEKSKQKGKKRD